MEYLFEDTRVKVQNLEKQGFNVKQKWQCELVEELESNEEMKRYIEECEIVDPLQPRDAFYGDVPTQQSYCTSVRAIRRSSKGHSISNLFFC